MVQDLVLNLQGYCEGESYSHYLVELSFLNFIANSFLCQCHSLIGSLREDRVSPKSFSISFFLT